MKFIKKAEIGGRSEVHKLFLASDPPPPPCVTFRRVVVSLRGPGQSPVLPFACCVGSLLSVGRCGRCSRWCRFRVRRAQWLVCWDCAECGGMCRLRVRRVHVTVVTQPCPALTRAPLAVPRDAVRHLHSPLDDLLQSQFVVLQLRFELFLKTAFDAVPFGGCKGRRPCEGQRGGGRSARRGPAGPQTTHTMCATNGHWVNAVKVLGLVSRRQESNKRMFGGRTMRPSKKNGHPENKDQTRTHARTHARAHARAHTQARTHARTHTHTDNVKQHERNIGQSARWLERQTRTSRFNANRRLSVVQGKGIGANQRY